MLGIPNVYGHWLGILGVVVHIWENSIRVSAAMYRVEIKGYYQINEQ